MFASFNKYINPAVEMLINKAGRSSFAVAKYSSKVVATNSAKLLSSISMKQAASAAKRVGSSAYKAGKFSIDALRWNPIGKKLPIYEPIASAGRPGQWNFAIQRRLVGLSLGSGAAVGLYGAATNQTKGVQSSMSQNGSLEVTQPLEATGDIALSMRKKVRGSR